MTEHAGVSVTAPVERRVEVAPGVFLHAEQRAGERAAAPFVLVHGLASNVRLWDGVAHDWPVWERMLRLYIGGHD